MATTVEPGGGAATWNDGPLCCWIEHDGALVAQVVNGTGGEWAAFDCSRLNQSKTGYLLVKGGFPDAESAKAFVDGSLPFPRE